MTVVFGPGCNNNNKPAFSVFWQTMRRHIDIELPIWTWHEVKRFMPILEFLQVGVPAVYRSTLIPI